MMQTALVTGGSKGIGYELAKQMAKRGYRLLLVSRNQQRLHEACERLQKHHDVECNYVIQNLEQDGAGKQLFDQMQEREETVDVLINNAGFGGAGRFDQQSLDTQLKMLQLNITTLVELTHLFVRPMIRRNRGKIMNVASTAAFQPGPGMALYYASKSFVLSLTAAIDVELSDHNITVSTLCPGPTSTDFHERAGTSGRILNHPLLSMKPERVARIGIQGLHREKALIVPGFLNKAGILAARILPRSMLKSIVYYLHRKG